MNTALIRFGDGYASVELNTPVPEVLTKKLKYWHRSFTNNYGKMVATGEYRELFTLSGSIDPDTQQFIQRIVTMPGFVHRVRQCLLGEGYEIKLVDERTPMPTPDYAAAFSQLRDYQCEPSYIAIASGGGVIACPTGYGKTHLMGSIIRAYSHDELAMRGTPLVVVAAPEKDITSKNYNDLIGMLPGREVGLVMSGKKKFSDDVQVITMDSLHLLDPEDVGILIADEVHCAAASSRSSDIMAFKKAVKWGVSATPTGRFDGRDLVTEGLFGPVVVSRTYDDGVKCGALVPISVYWLTCPEPAIGIQKYQNYKTRLGKYRHGVDRNASQNNLIIDLLKRIPPTKQALCIMPHVDQMNILAGMNKNLQYAHAVSDQAKLTSNDHRNLGPVSAKDRIRIYQEMSEGKIRQILSTYIYKQGVNFPQLEVIINAGGGGSDIVAAQIPGRESRNIEGKTSAVLIDFWHPWDISTDKENKRRVGPIHSDDRSREKVYDELGFKQYWLNSIDELPLLKEGTEIHEGQN